VADRTLVACRVFNPFAFAHAAAELRVALVVGNGAYVNTPRLANPLNDARDIAGALKARGFIVVEAYDADKRKLDEAMRAFTDQLAKADVALFFYAGHGLQVGLQNYILPVNAKLAHERDLEFEAVKLEFVLRQMEIDREGKTSIVILDACRDNPLARNLAGSMGTRSTAIGRGLATAPAGLGTFIAYSTQPGNVALDGTGRNSPFTAALLKHLPVPGRNLPALLIEVRKDVVAATKGQQVPWDHSALTVDFSFVQGEGSATAIASPAPPRAAETVATTPSASGIPSIQKKPDPAARSASSFELNENVRIEGNVFSSARQPNVDACRVQCDANPLCLGYQHGRRSPVMGQCQLFDRVDSRQEDASWRSGVRQSR
jgi:uncharacterized caspase-like protein